MRVVDRATSRNYMKYLNQARTAYAETNEKIFSGKRFTAMSEDVSAGTRVLRARTDMNKVEVQLDNIKSIQSELTTTEDSMTSINDVLSSVVGEKLLAAMDDSKAESGRTALANEISSLRQEILQFANTKFSTRYLFGGSNSSGSAPFSTDADGKLLYNGVDVSKVQRREDGSFFYLDAGAEKDIGLDEKVYLDIGLGIQMNGTTTDPNTALQVSYSGLEILGFGTNGGKSNNIFNILVDVEQNIRSFNKEKLGDLHAQLTEASDRFRANLTNIGAKTKMLESMQSRLEKTQDSYKTKIKDLMGIDDAEESMNQTMNDFVLKAVLQMGSNLLPVSLMDFLS